MTELRTALFGGSFNPIHNGHIALAREVLHLGIADEVWLMISPHNPLKASTGLLAEKQRFALAQKALVNELHIVASDFEFHLVRPSYTYLTLRALRQTYPDRTFSLLIGADNWICFDRWSHPDEIRTHHQIWVYPREGVPTIDQQHLPSGVHFISSPLYPYSSTEIRQAIATHHPITDMVPACIADDVVRLYTPLLLPHNSPR